MVQKEKGPAKLDVYPSYTGGHTTVYGGYVYEFRNGHHLQNIWGYVAQHRLVAEDIIGRPLRKGEVVHHKDEDRTHNDPSNLEILTSQEHRSHHAKRINEKYVKRVSRKDAKTALESLGGIKPAARKLGISHSTLRNKFPDLCRPYRRMTPTNIDNPRDIEKVLSAAPNPAIGLRELMCVVHMSSSTILRICKRNDVKWVKKRRSLTRHKYHGGKPTRWYSAQRAKHSALDAPPT